MLVFHVSYFQCFGHFWSTFQFPCKDTELGIIKRESIADYLSDLSNTLLIPGSKHANICLTMGIKPDSGCSLGDTEEMRGQTDW